MSTPVDATTDADRVAAAVIGCRAVAGLSSGPPSGPLGEVATYLPGRRVPGVAIREVGPVPQVEVHVVGRYGPTMDQISREVDAAVRTVLPGHRVLITIEDLDTGIETMDGDPAVPA